MTAAADAFALMAMGHTAPFTPDFPDDLSPATIADA
jgi:hypothetical protein